MMRFLTNLIKTLKEKKEYRETLPFFIIVSVLFLMLGGWIIYTTPDLQAPWPLVAFTVPLLLHIALYWVAFSFDSRMSHRIFYLVLQGGLAFLITLLARNLGAVVGLFSGLAGLSVGMLHDKRWSILSVLFYMGLAILSLILTLGQQVLLRWALLALPALLFAIIYVVLFARQADARMRAQSLLTELEVAHRQLAEYATRVEALTLVAERQRMARELHDTLAQGLAGLILQLEAVSSHLEHSRTQRAQAIVKQAMVHARATLADARRAIDDLRQEQVAPYDLEAAIRREVTRFTTATGLPCALTLDLPSNLSDILAEHVLRIVAESLTNIARHAQASRAWVTVNYTDVQLEIEIGDDGVGFDVDIERVQAGHYGLLGVRERVRLAKGTLEINSTVAQGTRLCLRLPLREQDESSVATPAPHLAAEDKGA